MAKYRDELTADFQSEYGICLIEDRYLCALAGDKTTPLVLWLSALAAQLPDTSRVAVAAHPENAWTTGDYLLRSVEFQLRAFAWALAGGEKTGPNPEPICSPGESAHFDAIAKEAERMADNVASVLGISLGGE